MTKTPPTAVAAKDPNNFSQINAGSAKETLASGYKGNIRVSQPLGSFKATSASGHKLQGTVTLQK